MFYENKDFDKDLRRLENRAMDLSSKFNVALAKVNFNESNQLVQQFKIETTPTFVLVYGYDAKEFKRSNGKDYGQLYYLFNIGNTLGI